MVHTLESGTFGKEYPIKVKVGRIIIDNIVYKLKCKGCIWKTIAPVRTHNE